jgi:uncharacterized protein YdeI (YjbR/CyaY-like superfamily)
MARAMDERERVEPAGRAGWRAWLAAHHDTSPGVWVVLRKGPNPPIGYAELVEEALAYGWIDSTARALDGERRMLHCGPRKAGSGWSRPNKQRIERLLADGLMAPPGLAVLERAKADGSWTLLDDVEELIVPPDLAAAFQRHPGAAEHWAAFPRSAKRMALVSLVTAKRPQTRAKRVEDVARRTAAGERP